MTQFSPVPRAPLRRGNRRMRRLSRFANAFRSFGGDGSENVTNIFSPLGADVIGIGSGAGNSEPVVAVYNNTNTLVTSVDNLGLSSPIRNETVITANTTLNSTQVNQILSIDVNAAVTITLQPDTDLVAGTWIGFQDVAGTTSEHQLSINPNNGSSGNELDGQTGSVVVVNENFGTGYVRLIKDAASNTNWFSDKASQNNRVGRWFVTDANAVLGTGDVGVLSNHNTLDREVYLPDATENEGGMVTVLKRLGAATTLTIYTKSGSGQTIDGVNSVTITGTPPGSPRLLVISDGANYYKILHVSA